MVENELARGVGRSLDAPEAFRAEGFEIDAPPGTALPIQCRRGGPRSEPPPVIRSTTLVSPPVATSVDAGMWAYSCAVTVIPRSRKACELEASLAVGRRSTSLSIIRDHGGARWAAA